jgi:hypothetical protein
VQHTLELVHKAVWDSRSGVDHRRVCDCLPQDVKATECCHILGHALDIERVHYAEEGADTPGTNA